MVCKNGYTLKPKECLDFESGDGRSSGKAFTFAKSLLLPILKYFHVTKFSDLKQTRTVTRCLRLILSEFNTKETD